MQKCEKTAGCKSHLDRVDPVKTNIVSAFFERERCENYDCKITYDEGEVNLKLDDIWNLHRYDSVDISEIKTEQITQEAGK